MAWAQLLEGRGISPRWWLPPMERLRGMVAPNIVGPLAGGREVLPKRWPVPMKRHRGWQPPTVWAHWPGGRGVLPRWWLQPMEHLQGMGAPNGRPLSLWARAVGGCTPLQALPR